MLASKVICDDTYLSKSWSMVAQGLQPQKTKQKKLTEEEVLVLKSHLEEWKEAAAEDRKKILKAVIKEAKVHAPAMDDRLLKKRKYVYQDWLYNRRPEKTYKKKASKYGQKWTSRSVIEQQHKEEIIEKTGAMPGSKKFIERYQTTLTVVMASLSKEQLEEAQKTAIKWSATAPPAGVQADFAKKKAPGKGTSPKATTHQWGWTEQTGHRTDGFPKGCSENVSYTGMMKDLATKLWKQAGVGNNSAVGLQICWECKAWKTEEDKVRINGIDFNEKLEGSSLQIPRTGSPCYQSGMPMPEKSSSILPEADLNDDDDDNEGEVKKSRKKGGKKEDYPLEVDTYGLPVVPDVEDLNLEGKKHLIRTFLTNHYMRKAQGDFIGAKFLPTGCKLDDPSKIRLVDADRLLELWRQRQKDQVQTTFEFKAWEGDDKMMREPVEMISGNNSDIRPRVPVKKSTGKRNRRMEQELSSEDDDDDDDNNDKEDGEEDKEEGSVEDNIHSPPSKSKRTKKHRQASTVPSDSDHEDPPPLVKNTVPVPKLKPTKMYHHATPVPSDSEHKDPPPLVKNTVPVPKPKPTKMHCHATLVPSDSEYEDPPPPVKKPVPVPKPMKKRGRDDPIQLDSESDSQPLVKKSKLTAI
ncbi:hypothetical protein EDB19DRAFT_2029931 [Suillus lakei]|nr:hypothetical protein EDB19DRAFT_2029931 [Suillus lakei]